MRAETVDWTVWQRPDVAGGFADRRASIPGAALQADVLRRLIGRVPRRSLRVLDLGCGDGYLLAAVMAHREVESAVALDGSRPMLERARARFADRLNTCFVQADFNEADWPSKLPLQAFDVIVSGFAIHHSEDEQKRAIYAAVFDLLAPGGLFVNVEHVASATPLGEDIWEHAWTEYDVSYRRARGERIDFDETLREHRTSEQKAANRLSSMQAQLEWLRRIGFVDVDCYFKYLELAVLAGFKERSGATQTVEQP